MSDEIVSVWGGSLRIGRAPAASELLIGDGSNFKLQSVDVTIDGSLGGSQGSIAYRNSTKWTHLSPGSAGKLLQTNGASADPSWVTLGESMTSFFSPLSGAIPFYNVTEWATLVPGPSGTIVASNGTIPVYATMTNLLDADIGNVVGGLLYRDVSGSWANSGPGPSGYVLAGGGAGANPTWTNSWRTLYKASSQSITSTSFTDDTTLKVSVVNGSVLFVEGVIFYNSGAGGSAIAVNGPSSFLQFSTDGASLSAVSVDTSFFSYASAGSYGVSFSGVFQANATGTFAVRHALNTASGTTTVQAGSWIKYYSL